jgi:hypothetical protein
MFQWKWLDAGEFAIATEQIIPSAMELGVL